LHDARTVGAGRVGVDDLCPRSRARVRRRRVAWTMIAHLYERGGGRD
jgi:hypothetical protein